jgi:hypothetical protein
LWRRALGRAGAPGATDNEALASLCFALPHKRAEQAEAAGE